MTRPTPNTGRHLPPVVRALKAMAHPARLRMLAMLASGELCVCQITAVLGLAASTVSGHLGDLRAAGLVAESKQGKWVRYRLTDDPGASALIGCALALLEGDGQTGADEAVVRTLRQVPLETLCAGGVDLAASGGRLDPAWRGEAEALRKAPPRGLLFLCVANSARSQMAEGIARALAPADVRVWSAGSQPSRVRLEAIAVLAEIGIDISRHRSKAVAEIPADQVDTVITLCGEEECPVFLGRARRLHWGLPDPAAVIGTAEDRLDAFRRTRDELSQRLRLVFREAPHGDEHA